MKNLISILVITLSQTLFAAEAIVDIKLSPAGSFSGKTQDVKGAAKKVGNKVIAENIVVNLNSLKTGIGLRDEHTLKYLDAKNHPQAILVKAEGENGKGTGIIKIKGIEKVITGTFKVTGQELLAEFPILLSDYKIDGISYKGIGVKDEAVVKVRVPLQ